MRYLLIALVAVALLAQVAMADNITDNQSYEFNAVPGIINVTAFNITPPVHSETGQAIFMCRSGGSAQDLLVLITNAVLGFDNTYNPDKSPIDGQNKNWLQWWVLPDGVSQPYDLNEGDYRSCIRNGNGGQQECQDFHITAKYITYVPFLCHAVASGPDIIITPTPTVVPTTIPTTVPTTLPTTIPTTVPTEVPTTIPTTIPTTEPTVPPTTIPTIVPTTIPTTVPTTIPTTVPTTRPTTIPTTAPVCYDVKTTAVFNNGNDAVTLTFVSRNAKSKSIVVTIVDKYYTTLCNAHGSEMNVLCCEKVYHTRTLVKTFTAPSGTSKATWNFERMGTHVSFTTSATTGCGR